MSKKHFIIPVLVSFIVYASLAALYDGVLTTDEAAYIVDAESILHGNTPDLLYIHRIVHILAVAMMEYITGYNLFAIRLYVIAASVGSVALMYLLLRERFNEGDSMLGALLFSSGPAMVYISPTIITDGIGLFYALLGLYLYVLYTRKGCYPYLLLSAITLSVGFLVREMIVAMMAAIGLHLLLSKRLKEVVLFSIIAVSVPIVYIPILSYLGMPNPWIHFIKLGRGAYNLNYRKYFFMFAQMLIGLQLIAVWGLYAISQKLRKLGRDVVNRPVEFTLLSYFGFSVILIQTFPLTNIRYFMVLLPALCYLVIESRLPSAIDRHKTTLIVLVSIAGYVGGISVGYFFILAERTTIEAVDWFDVNIPKGAHTLTNSKSIYYHLSKRGYHISIEKGEEPQYIIEVYTSVKAGWFYEKLSTEDTTLIKEFTYDRPAIIKRLTYGEGQTTNIYEVKHINKTN